MATQEKTMVSLKVLVDKECERVIFTEANKDFVDILFSFLTLPVGTVVRRIGTQSPPSVIGCMNNLHKSLEDLEAQHFQIETYKRMLLRVRNSSGDLCKKLKLNIDDTEPTKYYICSQYLRSGQHSLQSISTVANGQCDCGSSMQDISLTSQNVNNNTNGDDGVFVKGRAIFIITDDLQVMPTSTGTTFTFLSDLGIKDLSAVEKKTLNFGLEEVLCLLRHSFITKTPLTDVLLLEGKDLCGPVYKEIVDYHSATKREVNCWRNKICLKVMVRKSNNMVLYAEAGEDFVSFLFSMLTYPLGSLVKILDGSPSLGCLANLYKSVEGLSIDRHLKSQDHKDMLLSPKLALQYDCNDHNLGIVEVNHPTFYYNCRIQMYSGSLNRTLTIDKAEPNLNAKNGDRSSMVRSVNHKLPAVATTKSEGYVKGPAMFMVTDDLVVTPLSSISTISFIEELKIPIYDIGEQVVDFGEEEALILLEASLISKSVLTSALNLKAGLKKPKQEK